MAEHGARDQCDLGRVIKGVARILHSLVEIYSWRYYELTRSTHFAYFYLSVSFWRGLALVLKTQPPNDNET